jgi:hypothetical protein
VVFFYLDSYKLALLKEKRKQFTGTDSENQENNKRVFIIKYPVSSRKKATDYNKMFDSTKTALKDTVPNDIQEWLHQHRICV